MPTIIAICPYCRAGGIRAPQASLGDDATCPKCKSTYTVLPEDNLPDWVAKSKPDEKVILAPSAAPPRPKVAEEPPPSVAHHNHTSPSPTPETTPQPVAQETPVAQPLPEPPIAAQPVADSTAAPSDLGTVIALLALILVGPAVLASQLPFGRILALVISTVGLLGGLVSLGAEGRGRLFAAGAAALHAGILVVVLFLPSWLNLDPWGGAPTGPEEPKTPVAIDHSTGQGVPISPGTWLDASKSSWQFHDARVSMRAAVVPVELTGPNGVKKTPKANYLRVTIQVRNVGYQREIPLSDWAAGAGAAGVRVTDSMGQALSLAKFDDWTPDAGHPAPRAMPGLGSEVILVFTAPPSKSEFVRVQLSGAALGETEDIQFRSSVVSPVRIPGK